MEERRRESWAEIREQGAGRFVFHGVIEAALCVAGGQVIWWLVTFAWRGEHTLYFVREPGSSAAAAVGFLIAGYLRASREWRKNEREFLASVETNGNDPAVTRAGAI